MADIKTDTSTCPVCDSVSLTDVPVASGFIRFCDFCGHGFRPNLPDFSYNIFAMCSLGTSEARLGSQFDFMKERVSPATRILEIGCATGELADYVIRHGKPANYTAIELSPAADKAARIVNEIHREPLDTLMAKGAIAKGSADLVIMSHVLEHIPDFASTAAAIADVLTDDGAYFVEVPNSSGSRVLPIDDNVAHLHFFSVMSLSQAMAKAGLRVVKVETGALLDARYSDSIRALCVKARVPQPVFPLAEHPSIAGRRFVVWGAGSVSREVLANYISPDAIDFFVDNDPAKQGSSLMGRDIRSPDSIRGQSDLNILISSIDFAPIIEAQIEREFQAPNIVRLDRVLEDFEAALAKAA